MQNLNYQKALQYLSTGYSIIPLRRNKTPLLKENKVYQRDRLPTDEEVEDWFLDKVPEVNIGICTGKISGITVVDIDVGGGVTTSLDTFPPTYTVETPTGGFHLYYKYNKDIKQTANTFPQFPHVDIRNDGGYVVAPPSVCDYQKNKQRITGPYKVIKKLPIIDFPIDLFQVKKSSNVQIPSTAEVLANMDVMVDGDGRNVTLTKVAGKILQLGTDDGVSLSILYAANKQFKDPLPPGEVDTIFNSISAREKTKNEGPKIELIRNHKDVPIANEENVYRIMKADKNLAKEFRYNTFSGIIETSYGNKADRFVPFQREHITSVRMYLQRTYSFLQTIGHGPVEDSMMTLAHELEVSPPAEYIRSIEWDKKSRLDTWLSSVYHVEDNEYHQKVGSNWMKGLVKRLIEPGCKFDYVIVFEGEQGTKKSTSLAILGGSWHVETVFAPDNKDFFMLLSGNAIVEFSEGETLSRTESKRLKAVITMTNDKYRMPYDRSTKEFPRQCVFAMTTNQDQYLKDETGNRRWLPVKCIGVADVEWLKENRDQLFSEAYHRVITLKETTWEFPEEETRRQQELRQTDDPRFDLIYSWYHTKLSQAERDDGVTTRMAFVQAVCEGVSFGREMKKVDEMVISSILKDGLHLDKKREMIGGDRSYKYYPGEQTESIELSIEQQADVEVDKLFEPKMKV